MYEQELIARAIPVEDEPRFLRQLDDVRRIVGSGAEVSIVPLLTLGRRVRVAGGPLHGLEGVVDDPTNPSGIVISVDVLRQGLLLRLPAENLEVLP
jgi:hypothetical protein